VAAAGQPRSGWTASHLRLQPALLVRRWPAASGGAPSSAGELVEGGRCDLASSSARHAWKSGAERWVQLVGAWCSSSAVKPNPWQECRCFDAVGSFMFGRPFFRRQVADRTPAAIQRCRRRCLVSGFQLATRSLLLGTRPSPPRTLLARVLQRRASVKTWRWRKAGSAKFGTPCERRHWAAASQSCQPACGGVGAGATSSVRSSSIRSARFRRSRFRTHRPQQLVDFHFWRSLSQRWMHQKYRRAR